MHVADPAIGILGANAIVGAGMPLAVGAALASKLLKQGRVAVSFFGEGAVNQGVVPRVAQPRRDLGPAGRSSCARTTSTPSSPTAAG